MASRPPLFGSQSGQNSEISSIFEASGRALMASSAGIVGMGALKGAYGESHPITKYHHRRELPVVKSEAVGVNDKFNLGGPVIAKY
jgi:hypothetical protein